MRLLTPHTVHKAAQVLGMQTPPMPVIAPATAFTPFPCCRATNSGNIRVDAKSHNFVWGLLA